jgi:hypothetical protein
LKTCGSRMVSRTEPYDAFGTTIRELDWKRPVLSERAAPNTPHASYCHLKKHRIADPQPGKHVEARGGHDDLVAVLDLCLPVCGPCLSRRTPRAMRTAWQLHGECDRIRLSLSGCGRKGTHPSDDLSMKVGGYTLNFWSNCTARQLVLYHGLIVVWRLYGGCMGSLIVEDTKEFLRQRPHSHSHAAGRAWRPKETNQPCPAGPRRRRTSRRQSFQTSQYTTTVQSK